MSLTLINDDYKTKKFDKKDMESLVEGIKYVEQLRLEKAPVTDEIMEIFLSGIKSLQKLVILGCPKLTNKIFQLISENCGELQHLELGGEEMSYNNVLNKKGLKYLVKGPSELRSINFQFCTKIGNDSLELIGARYYRTLEEISLIRNCFEKCEKINDESLLMLAPCYNLKRIKFVYTRKFSYNFSKYISSFFSNLSYLNLRGCPVQEKLDFLVDSCPNLVEVNLSGDSWVKCECISGLAKHQNLKILHIGHIEHGDMDCDSFSKTNPPSSLFITNLFSQREHFSRLEVLYLEQICVQTYWIDGQILQKKPLLKVRYTPGENDWLTNTECL